MDIKQYIKESIKNKLNEETKLDTKELIKDLGPDSEIFVNSKKQNVDAKSIGHSSFKTKGGEIPVLKKFRRNPEKVKITVFPNQELVYDGEMYYYGYDEDSGHFRIHWSDID